MSIRSCCLILLGCILLMAGCSTTDVNPPAARVHTGYVDFYTEPGLDLWWEVKSPDEKDEMQVVFREYKVLPGPILRLASAPGQKRYQLWFANLATERPIMVPVEIVEGKVTPVHVTLTGVSSTTVLSKEYRFGGSAKGYGRGTKVTSEQTEVFRITAVPSAPEDYRPKDRMPYFAPADR